MLTVIILLSLASIKEEITDFINLFSTLQGDAVVAGINTSIIVGTFLLEMRYISVYDGSWQNYFVIVAIVTIVAGVLKYFLVKFKQKLRHWMRRKNISKGQKKSWEKRKQEKDDIKSLCIGEMK